MGADLNPSGDDSQIQITYQIAIPIKITGENNETGNETYTTYTTIAPSLSIATSKINTMTSKDVDLSHVSLILYSKELAEKGLDGHVNSLISNIAIRPKTIISICEGKAKNFLEEVTPILETSPARYYELLISSFQFTSRSTKTEVLDFYTASKSPYQAPIAVFSKLTDQKEAQFSGICAFKGLKYVGQIAEEFMIGHLLLTNNLTEANIAIPCPQDKNKTITLTLKEKKKPKISIRVEDNIPYADIQLYIEAHLDSNGGNIDFYQKENAKLLTVIVQDSIKKIVSQYLQETISLGADTCGLGRFVKKNYLTWDEFKKLKWKSIYSKLEYNIEINCDLNISQVVSNFLPVVQ